MSEKYLKTLLGLAAIIVLLCMMIAFTSCTSVPKDQPVAGQLPPKEPGPFFPETPIKPIPVPTPEPVIQFTGLSWENTIAPHPEREIWSQHLNELIYKNLVVLSSAQDIEAFCPKFRTLDDKGKVKAWGELFVALAYFESSYNPDSSSVDVGTKSDKNSYSIGLWSMSVIDQPNYGCPLGYDYNALLAPLNNEDLMMCIFVKQIKKYGIIQVPAGKGKPGYWATLGPGNKYNEIKAIQDRVNSKSEGCI